VSPIPPLAADEAVNADLPAFERVALLLREEIIRGQLQSGQALVEAELVLRFGVSRNTIRESLRGLRGEGLVSYSRNRGVSVSVLGQADIRDIYIIRRALEMRAVSLERGIPYRIRAPMEEAIRREEEAMADGDWSAVGTHSLQFHQLIVSMLGSARLDRFFASIVAQMRLLFSCARDESSFQYPWVARDQHLHALLVDQQYQQLSRALQSYLDDSERTLIQCFNPYSDFEE
jgi:DNA-binding GntR family transcriptional regulator